MKDSDITQGQERYIILKPAIISTVIAGFGIASACYFYFREAPDVALDEDPKAKDPSALPAKDDQIPQEFYIDPESTGIVPYVDKPIPHITKVTNVGHIQNAYINFDSVPEKLELKINEAVAGLAEDNHELRNQLKKQAQQIDALNSLVQMLFIQITESHLLSKENAVQHDADRKNIDTESDLYKGVLIDEHRKIVLKMLDVAEEYDLKGAQETLISALGEHGIDYEA